MSDSEQDEFVRMMTRHQRQVWWFINTMLPAASDADDVLQETNLVLWRKRQQFDRSCDFMPWACGIARLQALAFVRQHRSNRRHLSEAVLVEIANDAERQLRDVDRVEIRLESLKKCIERLGDPEREIVEARYFRAWTAKRIADGIEIPASTVYKILGRARIQLVNCVNQRMAGEVA